jgi:L-methionine (R)-S-oxide reductase
MIDNGDFFSLNEDERWSALASELESLLNIEEPLVTLFANSAAFLDIALDRLNWAGFYFLRGDTLFLGPFIGKPACTQIAIGKGVCGACVEQRLSIVVQDVDAFPGHIACDSASRSEIALPLILASGRMIGVLDLDSPIIGRFTDEDKLGLELLRDVIVSKLGRMIKGDGAVFA